MPEAPAPAAVLRLVTRLNVGGPARQALLLTRALAAEFPTLLAAGRAPAVEGELHDPAVVVHPVPLVRPLRATADARAVLAVRRLLARTGARILHTHMAKAGAVGRLAAAGVRSRPRTVHTFHGHVLGGYFGPAAERAFLEVERRLARRTDVLVAVSAEVRDELLALGVGRPEQYRVLPLGLPLDPFLADDGPSGQLRRRLGLGSGVPLVGVVGRLVPVKDHETVLAAVARVPGVHLAVLGDGELRVRLEERARDAALAGRVHFTGWWDDMASAVSDLDVVVLGSRNEGTPVALIEASAAARAVVATRVGGVPSVVEHGVTGLLAGPGDAVALAAHLRRLLADPAARRRMGEAGRARVRERFGEDRLVADVGALYGELLGGAGERAAGRPAVLGGVGRR